MGMAKGPLSFPPPLLTRPYIFNSDGKRKKKEKKETGISVSIEAHHSPTSPPLIDGHSVVHGYGETALKNNQMGPPPDINLCSVVLRSRTCNFTKPRTLHQ
ncbi:hypothetical protein H6P81_019503 [Aristolochia fimbriata]|uniref:Uncharacterized protein n=1 Tax=Aristolochia fimbriata TaxID=158543 RepID=A0AAV7DWJ6_ARIFI|nr:hypothetical protein H6P81_019503 [Aristolochia fimbriata]